MKLFFERLMRVLPSGSQLLWDDWREKPAVWLEDLDGDGKREMIASYHYENETYSTIFKHDGGYWHVLASLKGTDLFRVKGINLFPASVTTVSGTKWGYINENGNFVTPVKYEDAKDFQKNGLAAVKLNGEYGLINRFGQFIVQPMYSSINPFYEGRAVVMNNQGFKVINEWGKEVTKKAYSFIGNFQEERAMFADTNEEGLYLYGFLNKQGKEIIPQKYESVTNFQKGKAVVKISDGKYELIDQKGKTLLEMEFAYVGEYSEGLMAVQKDSGGKFGYIDDTGKMVIEPTFTGAQAFKGGRAVVNMDEQYGFQYGLIDENGKLIIEAIYNDISILGENRIAIGIALDKNNPFIGSKYAIADTNGKILTPFSFRSIQDYVNGYASATDGVSTFFLNKSGEVAKNLPVVKGDGVLTFEGALIKANIDMRLRYYNLKGLLVWSENQIIPLNQRFKVIERKYKPNKDYLVYYPEISGMRFAGIQKKVNEKLAELSRVIEIAPNIQLKSSYTGDFKIFFFKKQLVVFEFNGYDYPFGAAHGMPSMVYPHVDLESGVFYELKDLFKPNSSYVEVLSGMVAEQIKNDPQYSYIFPDTYKGISASQPFYVDDNNLYLYFTPYEIAPFAAGFPTFTIPFNGIDNIINKEGAFWKAFH